MALSPLHKLIPTTKPLVKPLERVYFTFLTLKGPLCSHDGSHSSGLTTTQCLYVVTTSLTVGWKLTFHPRASIATTLVTVPINSGSVLPTRPVVQCPPTGAHGLSSFERWLPCVRTSHIGSSRSHFVCASVADSIRPLSVASALMPSETLPTDSVIRLHSIVQTLPISSHRISPSNSSGRTGTTHKPIRVGVRH